MPNLLRGMCELEVEGRTYALVYDQNAICELEGQLNEPFFNCAERWAKDAWAFREIRAILWAGLRRHHPKVSLEQCGDMMGIVSPRPLMEAILPAFVKAFPKPQEMALEDSEKNVEAGVGNGKPS